MSRPSRPRFKSSTSNHSEQPLIGRLTRDPETRFTGNGKAITSFCVAYDVGWGEKKRAVFLDCKMWGERGENLGKFVRKGHRVGLEGSLDQEEWDDKTTGEKRKKFVFDVRDFTLIERKAESEEQEQRQQAPQRRVTQTPLRRSPPGTIDYGDSQQDGMEESDIPF
jgi:single-strand DNA-binding protein